MESALENHGWRNCLPAKLVRDLENEFKDMESTLGRHGSERWIGDGFGEKKNHGNYFETTRDENRRTNSRKRIIVVMEHK